MVTKARTEDDLVELFELVVDREYARALLDDDGVGADVVHSQAAQFAELDLHQLEVQQAYYLLPASEQLGEPSTGAVAAYGTVLVSRRDSGLGPRTLEIGTQLESRIVDTMGVERVTGYYDVIANATFEEGDVGPISVSVRANDTGFAGNRPAGSIVGFRARGTGTVSGTITNTTTIQDDPDDPDKDRFNEGELFQFVTVQGLGVESYPRLIVNVSQGLTAADPTIITVDPALPVTAVGDTRDVFVRDFDELFSVEQPTAMIGGRDDNLDEVGRERNQPRSAGETNDQYRQRLSRLEDTISPAAIERICSFVLQPLGIRFHVEETKEDVRGFILDLAPLDTGEVCDALDAHWSGSVLLNENDAQRFFVVCVSAPDALFGNPGKPYDASTAGANAYDSGGPGDGQPILYNQAIALLWKRINAARAWGVNFTIVKDANL